jgi:hypothetical protein
MILSSCLTTHIIQIDQLEPGSVEIPEKVQKLAILSRNFKFSVDTLQNYISKDGKLLKATTTGNINIDSITTTETIEELKKYLLENDRFKEIITIPYSAFPPYSGTKIIPLSQQFVKKIGSETGCDAVISLEMISYFYSIEKGDKYENIPDHASVKINAIWALYLPDKQKLIDRYTYSDNLNWEDSPASKEKDVVQIPPRIDAFKIASGISAKKYANRLVSHWVESEREIVALSGEEWIKAKKFASESNWEMAAGIWEELAKSKKKNVAATAKYDYAVACEMLGSLDDALFWANQSLSDKKSGESSRLATEYIKYLNNRKLIIQKIKITEKPASN